MDKLTTSQSRVTFARICVEVKADNPLPETISFIDEESTKHTQEVIYEWLPKMCLKCKAYGHNCLAPPQLAVNQHKGQNKGLSAQAQKTFQKQQPFSDKYTTKRPLRTNSPFPNERLGKNIEKQKGTQKDSTHIAQSHIKILASSDHNKFALLHSLDSEDSVRILSPKPNGSPIGNLRRHTKATPKTNKTSPQTDYSHEEENVGELDGDYNQTLA